MIRQPTIIVEYNSEFNGCEILHQNFDVPPPAELIELGESDIVEFAVSKCTDAGEFVGDLTDVNDFAEGIIHATIGMYPITFISDPY